MARYHLTPPDESGWLPDETTSLGRGKPSHTHLKIMSNASNAMIISEIVSSSDLVFQEYHVVDWHQDADAVCGILETSFRGTALTIKGLNPHYPGNRRIDWDKNPDSIKWHPECPESVREIISQYVE